MTTVADVVQGAIAKSVARLAAHEAALGRSEDAEDVHQARVATRRLRSDLRTFRPFLDESWADGLRAELRWLGAELGPVRDIEVLEGRLRSHAGTLPDAEHEAVERVISRLLADAAGARAELVGAVASDRYRALRERLDAAARTPSLTPAASRPARRALRRILRRPLTQLRRAVVDLPPAPADEALHAVRIRAKRCRYAAEAVADVLGAKTARFAGACAALQAVLGEHQDAVVARAWLAKSANECSTDEAYAAGMLAAIELRCARAARDAFPGAWRNVERRAAKL